MQSVRAGGKPVRRGWQWCSLVVVLGMDQTAVAAAAAAATSDTGRDGGRGGEQAVVGTDKQAVRGGKTARGVGATRKGPDSWKVEDKVAK